MLLLTQTKILINMDHVRDIYCDNGNVYAELDNEKELFLCKYFSNEIAERAIENIGECYKDVTLLKL